MKVIVVLSLPRCGTSVLARIIGGLGGTLPFDLLPAHAEINPDGFFESQALMTIRCNVENAVGINFAYPACWSEPDWTKHLADGTLEPMLQSACDYFRQLKSTGVDNFVFKDPRTTALLPFWEEVFQREQLTPHFVLALRNPHSAAKSIHTFTGHSHIMGYLLWLESVTHLATYLREKQYTLIVYEKWFRDDRQIRALSQSLFNRPPSQELINEIGATCIKDSLNRNSTDHSTSNAITSLAERFYTDLSAERDDIGQISYQGVYQEAEIFLTSLRALGNVLYPRALRTLFDFNNRELGWLDKLAARDSQISLLQDEVSALRQQIALNLAPAAAKEPDKVLRAAPIRMMEEYESVKG